MFKKQLQAAKYQEQKQQQEKDAERKKHKENIKNIKFTVNKKRQAKGNARKTLYDRRKNNNKEGGSRASSKEGVQR